MARENVKYNDKFACFCTISDSFVTELMFESEYDKWQKDEYGKCNYKPLHDLRIISMKDAVSEIRLNKTHDETIKKIIECGLSKMESEAILYIVERNEYRPVQSAKGIYTCPNCGGDVKLEQRVCNNELCEIKFIWIL